MTTRQADARAITVTPATAARWDDVVATFGTKGDPSWCWCQYFATTGASYEKSAAANKDALHGQVTARPARRGPRGCWHTAAGKRSAGSNSDRSPPFLG